MSKFNLDETLRAAKMPERSEEYWQDFPRRISSRLSRPASARAQSFRIFPRLAWAGAFAVLCLLVGFGIGLWRGRTGALSNRLLENTKLIRETLAMFPNRVRAITLDERGLNVVLSDHEDVPASTPLYVQICNGSQCSALVTFSGQELDIAGQKITVLSDAQGGIILEGNEFIWSSTGHTYAKGELKIQARQLAPIML